MPSPALIEEARRALNLHHSSSCPTSHFTKKVGPCNCGATKEAERIVLAIGPLIAEQIEAKIPIK